MSNFVLLAYGEYPVINENPQTDCQSTSVYPCLVLMHQNYQKGGSLLFLFVFANFKLRRSNLEGRYDYMMV